MDLTHSYLIRYLLAGSAVFILSALQYRIIYFLLPAGPLRVTLAWAVCFVIGSVWVHAIHRWYTFRHALRRRYSISLLRAFVANLAMGVVSTAMIGLYDFAGTRPAVGWIATTVAMAVVNYLSMRYFSVVAD